jgi:hypothetical protein
MTIQRAKTFMHCLETQDRAGGQTCYFSHHTAMLLPGVYVTWTALPSRSVTHGSLAPSHAAERCHGIGCHRA